MPKIALLIGINYVGTSGELRGCINDVNNTKDKLINIYGFDSVKSLTDDSSDPKLQPTFINIITSLYELIIQSINDPTTEVWITYSGHGSYIRDYNGDESDRKDETIIPVDYKTYGMITDDLLHYILGLFPESTTRIVIMDCCHSGTILDLPYRYVSGDKIVKENHSSKIKGNIIVISGCQDDQTSADVVDLTTNIGGGAMTMTLLDVLETYNYTIDCWSLLKKMRVSLQKKGYTQIPQLSTSVKLVDGTLFSLSHETQSFIATK